VNQYRLQYISLSQTLIVFLLGKPVSYKLRGKSTNFRNLFSGFTLFTDAIVKLVGSILFVTCSLELSRTDAPKFVNDKKSIRERTAWLGDLAVFKEHISVLDVTGN